ncbi:ferric reductase like transmembrane component-domain-containing protein, partial [Phakopsora pachyrhizi]
CILGYTNGTYPNGTLGKGNWEPFGIYMPSATEKAACQNAYEPWTETPKYGWWTTYFILAVLAVVSIINGARRLHNLNRIHGLQSPISFHPKVSALFRWASYPQLKAFGGFIPAVGPSFLIFGFLIFSIAVCFLRRPYYRPPNFGNSPLGFRSEWIATAMIPWIYASATKRNFLVYFSGVSYHRILTIHKWAPWICLFMSIVHTWAMIIRADRQQPWWYTMKTNPYYWNGIPALIALTWLCIMSLDPIRNRFYETFYVLHIFAAVVFLVWMYIHLNNLLESWQYMHSATILWGAAIAWRFVVHAFDHGWFKKIPRASVEMLGADAIKISVPMPSNRTWGAGSYVYLRFLSIRPWESHPFTISSLPAPLMGKESDAHGKYGVNQMVFLIRPRAGLTARLRSSLSASQGPLMRSCLVDGPYEGYINKLRACDSAVLLAGGSGMAAIIPVAQALKRASGEIGMSCCQNIRVIWAIKDLSCLVWFKDQLDEVKGLVSIYSTGVVDSKLKLKKSLKNESDISKQSFTPEECFGTLELGRPNIHLTIDHAVRKLSGRLGVLVCGPDSMVLGARNSVAALQKQILTSDESIQCNEIEFFEESYSF